MGISKESSSAWQSEEAEPNTPSGRTEGRKVAQGKKRKHTRASDGNENPEGSYTRSGDAPTLTPVTDWGGGSSHHREGVCPKGKKPDVGPGTRSCGLGTVPGTEVGLHMTETAVAGPVWGPG